MQLCLSELLRICVLIFRNLPALKNSWIRVCLQLKGYWLLTDYFCSLWYGALIDVALHFDVFTTT